VGGQCFAAPEGDRGVRSGPSPNGPGGVRSIVLIVTGPSGAGKTTVASGIAASSGAGVHLRMDGFVSFIASGRIEPWGPEAYRQDRAVGAAALAAGLQFARAGYDVVVDGHIFPAALDELCPWMTAEGVALHYVVLRTELSTCLARAGRRNPGDPIDVEAVTALHDRFRELGAYAANVIDAEPAPELVIGAVRRAHAQGRLRVS
jgi:predicted kinase